MRSFGTANGICLLVGAADRVYRVEVPGHGSIAAKLTTTTGPSLLSLNLIAGIDRCSAPSMSCVDTSGNFASAKQVTWTNTGNQSVTVFIAVDGYLDRMAASREFELRVRVTN